MTQNITKLSDNLSQPIKNIYRLVNMASALMLIGVITMICANFYKSTVSVYFFSVSAILTLTCLGFFIYAHMHILQKFNILFQENQESVDTLQNLAIDLTKTASTIQSFSSKNAQQVSDILDTTIPLLANIPFVGKKIDNTGLSRLQNLSKTVMNVSTQAATVIQDVEQALVNADIKELKTYPQKLQELNQSLRNPLVTRSQ